MKDSLWRGIGIAIGAEILFLIVFLAVGPIFDSLLYIYIMNSMFVILFLGVLIWGIVLLTKNKKKLGLGIIIGLFIPPLIVGACATVLILSY